MAPVLSRPQCVKHVGAKTETFREDKVNTMASGVWATQGAQSSAAMVVTLLS